MSHTRFNDLHTVHVRWMFLYEEFPETQEFCSVIQTCFTYWWDTESFLYKIILSKIIFVNKRKIWKLKWGEKNPSISKNLIITYFSCDEGVWEGKILKLLNRHNFICAFGHSLTSFYTSLHFLISKYKKWNLKVLN